MESAAQNAQSQQERQRKLRDKIARLQAQLDPSFADSDESPGVGAATPSKRDREASTSAGGSKNVNVLVPGSPSPKRQRIDSAAPPRGAKGTALASKFAAIKQATAKETPPAKKPTFQPPPPPRPSNMVAALAAVQPGSDSLKSKPEIERTTDFAQAAPAPVNMEQQKTAGLDRDESLALIENLEPGPFEHKPPPYDPKFENLEPNSGINLSSRKIPHEELQDYLRGRYYLSPSLLYSVARPLPNRQGYDIPVPGDWVTIAVVAERGKIQQTRGTVKKDGDHAVEDDEEEDGTGGAGSTDKPKKKEEKLKPKTGNARKYLNFRLIDFGHRRASSANPKAGAIGGDAVLNMLLFQADSYSALRNDAGLDDRVYKGGSGGAYEKCAKFAEGSVVAILNPKILKPLQGTTDKPNPNTNVLAITPESAGSIMVIGRSKDLGHCNVVKRDGSVCGSWCDKRVSEVCEWHVLNAVKSTRAGRAEFSIGTSGMSTTAQVTKKKSFDPDRKWGLQPKDGSQGASRDPAARASTTYMFSGHVINSSGPEFIGEKFGRERSEREERKRRQAEEAVLERLLTRDGGKSTGAIAMEKAKIAAGKGKGKEKEKEKGKEKAGDGKAVSKDPPLPTKNAFSAEVVRKIGFDPTGRMTTAVKTKDKKRAESLALLQSLQSPAGREITLAARPGKRRSGVCAPIPTGTKLPSRAPTIKSESSRPSDDDGLEIVSDESDLEIEPPLS